MVRGGEGGRGKGEEREGRKEKVESDIILSLSGKRREKGGRGGEREKL